MLIAWPPPWWKDRNRLKKLWLIAAGITAIYYGAIQPRQAFRGVAMQRASALAAIEDSRHEHWFQPNLLAVREELQSEGVVGGVPASAAYQKSAVTQLADDNERKIVRTSSIALIVEKPADAAGGFLVNWQANGDQEATSASLMIRVPVAKFESTRTAIRKLAQRVENERVEAEDASTQYVDDRRVCVVCAPRKSNTWQFSGRRAPSKIRFGSKWLMRGINRPGSPVDEVLPVIARDLGRVAPGTLPADIRGRTPPTSAQSPQTPTHSLPARPNHP